VTTAHPSNRPFVMLATGALVVALLHVGQPLLAPLAVALLIVFLLAPAVDWLQRRGLRGPAPVVLVMLALIAAVAGVGVLVVAQSQALLEQLPQYESNIREKLTVLRDARSVSLSPAAQRTLTELGRALEEPADAAHPATAVMVVEPSSSLLQRARPLLGPLAGVTLALSLAFFVLLQRRALRDRIIHTFGRRNLSLTTRALEEAGERISHYLRVQGLLNLGFGVAIALGLAAIGLDFAALWGLLAALLRFIPYVGPWLAAAMPATLSLATAPGWGQPLEVLGLFAVVELTINLMLEPLLYGRSAGLSPVAIVLAVSFWTLIWGPVGLFVATPLTVCACVLCRRVPQLRFIAFLLGDEPVATDDAKFYQRMLAHDEDEALHIALGFARRHGAEQVHDALLLPALSALKADRMRDEQGDADVDFGMKAARHIAEAIEGPPPPPNARRDRPVVLALPASDELDALALELLRQVVLRAGHCELELLGSELLVSEMLAHVNRTRPALVCIGTLAPGGLARAQLLCRRLRAAAPQLRIIVGRWCPESPDEELKVLGDAGADRTSTTMLGTLRDLDSLCMLAMPA